MVMGDLAVPRLTATDVCDAMAQADLRSSKRRRAALVTPFSGRTVTTLSSNLMRSAVTICATYSNEPRTLSKPSSVRPIG